MVFLVSALCKFIKVIKLNIAKGTTDPRVEFISQDYSSQFTKGWGQSAKLGKHSGICSKLGTALQAYALNPCTKFPPNPTSRKVNT